MGQTWRHLLFAHWQVEAEGLGERIPPQVNVRTYVTVDGKLGIYFLSLDASNRLAVAVARRTYRLPYFRSRISLDAQDGGFFFRSERVSKDGEPAGLAIAYAPTGRWLPQDDSLARFLAERYCLYTLSEGGRVHRADIHHPPWPLQEASGSVERNSMASPYGLEFSGDPILHFSERQDVVLWNLEPTDE
jgi:uncharacterized protein YqjF (DUF2071 family)